MVLAQQKLIWLIALIAIFLAFHKLKTGHFLYRSKAMKLMGAGCVMLIFGVLVGLAGHMGLLGIGYSKSVPYFVIESVIGYVVGWSLVIWGMALWLPYLFSVSNRLQKKTKSVNLYEAISKVSAYGDASPTTFGRIAGAVLENFGYQAASLHVTNTENMLSLFASVGLTEKSKKLLNDVKNTLIEKVHKTGEVFMADESIRIHKNIIIETVSGPVVEAVCLPVDFGARRVGALTVYTDHPRVFTQEELRVLEAVCANLGLAFYREGLQHSINSQLAFRDLVAVLLKTARADDNLNTRLIRQAKFLKHYMKFESLNLYLMGDGPPQQLDFSLPHGGKVVIEKGFFKGDFYRPIRWAADNRRSLILPDNAGWMDKDFKFEGETKLLYTPLINGRLVAGVLGLSVSKKHRFNQNDLIAFETIASVVSASLMEELTTAITTEAMDRIGAINYSLEHSISQKPIRNIFRELARIVVEKTPATLCRIMLFDKERKAFRTEAIYQRRGLAWDESTFAGLPATELFAHRKVMATGRPEIICDNDQTVKMSKPEAELLLPEGVCQCMIIPIKIYGKAAGVVTIGESRRSNRSQFGSMQLIFASLLTNVIAMALLRRENLNARNALQDTNRLALQKLSRFENQVDSMKMMTGFNSRLNGPLAGIMASCEYLKNRPDIKREEFDRYINLINKNADKIYKLSSQFADVRRAVETVNVN